jgi:hypothetical protein
VKENMSTVQTHFTRDQIGWLLSSGAAVLLGVMVLYAIPPDSRPSFFFQMTFVMLVTGGALAAGLLKYRNH